MAKGKHAAALFEVIHSDRRFGKKTPPARALATPKWWFKGKKTDGQAAGAPTASVSTTSATTTSATTTGAATTGAATTGGATAPQPIDYLPPAPYDPTDPTARQVDVKVDPDRQEIAFKLTYTSAIVGGFALVVVLSLAYVIGRKMNAGPTGAIAATVSSNAIRKGEPQKGVMDLAKARRDGVTSITPDGDESANVIDPLPQTTTTSRPPVPPPHVKPATPEQPFNGKRLINQNYVVIQSFPPEEKALADEAVKRLAEARIGATIERGLSGWPSTWYVVVGTVPFERTRNNPVYDTYIKSIMDVSAKYAGKSQFKKFAPTAKKWQGDA